MGCASSNAKISEEEKKSINLVPVEIQEIGLLKVAIQPIREINKFEQFYSENSNFFIQLSFCNQTFITSLSSDEVLKSNNTLIPKRPNLEFAINQLEIEKCLDVRIYSECVENEQIKTASGKEILKEDFFKPLIGEKSSKKTSSIEIVFQNNLRVGWVIVSLEFIPFKYDTLGFRLNSVNLRNETKEGRQIYVKIKIGGEEYQTHMMKSSEKRIPEWENAIHGFIVPEFLPYGKLSVYEKDEKNNSDELLGELMFNLRMIMKSDEMQSFSEPIQIESKITGSVCMQFLKTKGMMPEIPVIELPKKIKYSENIELEKVEKETCEFVNYIRKKSNVSTNCTSEQSFEIKAENLLNKKLEELRSNPYILVCKKNFTLNDVQTSLKSLEMNEFSLDGLHYKNNVNKDNTFIYENHEIKRIYSDAELSFTIDIPETSSKLIEKVNSISSKNDVPSLKLSSTSISRNNSLHKIKEGSIKMERDESLFKKNNEDCKMKMNLLEYEQKFHLQKENKIIYLNSNELLDKKLKENDLHFDSLPDEIFSNSVCIKNESILENESQNKSEFFSNSLSERSNENEKPENRFSNEIKAMESINKKILCNLDQNECKNFSKNNKTIKINIPQEEIYYGEEYLSKKENENIEPNYDFDGFDIKLSSIISKKMNNCEPVIV